MPGTLFVVATPIGNLEDISARALRVLGDVTLIAAEDTRRTARLLARYAIRTPTTSLHAHNEHAKARHLVDRLLENQSIALVSDAGTPTLSDPGAGLVRAAVEAGIRVEPIPGPSAVTALLSVTGHASQTFLFLGFPPTKGRQRRQWFAELAKAGRPCVFLEAPHRIKATLSELVRGCGDPQLVIGREMTKQHEEIIRGRASAVLNTPDLARGELTVLMNPEGGGAADEATIGRSTDVTPHLVGHKADLKGSVDRAKAAEIARVLGLKTNDVYSAFVRSAKSAK